MGLKKGGVISLVGAGGKTSMMFRLARELSRQGVAVLTTTTTKIYMPTRQQSSAVIVAEGAKAVLRQAKTLLRCHRHISAGSRILPFQNKLKGFAPDVIDDIWQSGIFRWIIVEADGAAQHSLKAPGDYEPVIPAAASLVIPVVGIDALGETLGRVVFRPEIASRLLGVSLMATITPEIVASLVTAKSGIAKGSPVGARIIPLINKVDVAGGLEKGRLVAKAIIDKAFPKIEEVVLGHVGREEAVVEVVRR